MSNGQRLDGGAGGFNRVSFVEKSDGFGVSSSPAAHGITADYFSATVTLTHLLIICCRGSHSKLSFERSAPCCFLFSFCFFSCHQVLKKTKNPGMFSGYRLGIPEKVVDGSLCRYNVFAFILTLRIIFRS